MQNPFEKKRGYSPKGLRINSRPKGCLYSSYNKGTGLSPRSQFLPSFKLTLGNKFPESVIHIGCTPLLLLLWNPLVFRLFFAFGPYFKWILSSFDRKGEKKTLLVLGNYRKEEREVEIPGTIKKVLLSNVEPRINGNTVKLSGYEALILEVE